MSVLCQIEPWGTPAVDVGPLYPGVGSEGFLVLVCVVAWLGWTVWQIKAENKEYAEQVAALRGRSAEEVVIED